MINPESRIAVVTGSARGIGRAIAERLIADGSEVILLDLADHVDQTAEEIKAVGALQIDVRDVESLQAGIHSVAREQGRLDILVNCAGTCGRESFETLSPQIWHRDLDTNLTATAFACQAAVFPHMREQGWGRLVNVVSVSGKVGGIGPVDRDGTGGRSGAAYASAKAGAINLTRWIARQVGPWGITCNAVAPGPIASPMAAGADYGVESLPIPRFGKPTEVAGAVSYLLTPDADYTTGTCLHVDGGSVLT
ncbi:SDR family NAD(P)-dependent oxidoreductase [Rhodococcus wratislaviensis]|uniref:Putative 3-oxoacyl-[acyl-carrier-protein] reductase n=1 Tax=Rhodococcus wratislaviensis NBRC 100605 TaxID=1219028 RepID=X0PMI6_RHOWR|nr:SDR family NAD(P)-dependent oxidoreductase [Rhodococcus wratislaviensis]GAF43774.1 putative 3-oxoacyl-[acyl-carrier-protein] reductase [Rhodococcus wratislaviensis NBRC 100605]